MTDVQRLLKGLRDDNAALRRALVTGKIASADEWQKQVDAQAATIIDLRDRLTKAWTKLSQANTDVKRARERADKQAEKAKSARMEAAELRRKLRAQEREAYRREWRGGRRILEVRA